jgi:hypothetical protein
LKWHAARRPIAPRLLTIDQAIRPVAYVEQVQFDPVTHSSNIQPQEGPAIGIPVVDPRLTDLPGEFGVAPAGTGVIGNCPNGMCPQVPPDMPGEVVPMMGGELCPTCPISPGCPCCDCCCWPCECPCPPAACLPCPRINLINPCWQLLVGGNITLDMLYNGARPVAPGTPFFLTPRGAFEDATFDMHARQTSMYFALMGPQMGNFRSGGLILFNLYNDNAVADRYGFLPIQAYGQLQNETWRFAAGLQTDIFAPLLPTVLPFSYLMASGNAGVFRGQIRAERYWYPAYNSQLTFIAGLSEPISTTIHDGSLVPGAPAALTEDNGFPDLEMRLAWAVGPKEQVGLETKRPFEVGLSTVLGQIRTTFAPPLTRVVDDIWGLACDFRWRVTDRFGFSGEVFHGQTLGEYGAGVFQNVNSVTFQPVHASGGWGQIDFYFNPCLHSHLGYGADDPADSELAPGQIALNRTAFANLIWDINSTFRVAGELTYRDTDYLALPGNDGIGLHGQVQWKF